MLKVEGYSGWFIVNTNDKRKARKEGIKEWGRGYVKEISEATDKDIEYYRSVKGQIIEPSED